MARLIRCPVCLRPGRDPGPRGQLRCKGCQRVYTGQDALAFDTGGTESSGETADLLWRTGLPVGGALLTFMLVSRMDWVGASTRGGHFLLGFIIFGLVLRVLLSVARKLGFDSWTTTLAAIGVFEGVGVLRWVHGRAAGLQDFEILFVLMGIGLALFMVRGDSLQGSSAGNGSTGSSCSSSSCSGCGGGGGGCGGCGG